MGKGKSPWTKVHVGPDEAYTVGAARARWLSPGVRHHSSTPISTIVCTIAGQSSLLGDDATTASERNKCKLHTHSATSTCSTIGRANSCLAAPAADEGSGASPNQLATQRDSERTTYSRGALLAARCSAQAAGTTGTTTSVLTSAPNSTNYCVSHAASSDAGNAPRNGLSTRS